MWLTCLCLIVAWSFHWYSGPIFACPGYKRRGRMASKSISMTTMLNICCFTWMNGFYSSFSSHKNKQILKPRRLERRLMVDQLIIFLYEMRNEAIGLMTWFVKEWSLKRSRFVEVIHGGEMIRKVLVLTYFAQKITSVLSTSSSSLWSFYPFFMWRNLDISLHHPFYQ